MASSIDLLPLQTSVRADDQESLASTIKDAFNTRTPVYPIGGGTSLDYGLPARQPGIGLELSGLSKVIDYPARDMTITVEAGITMDELANVLATEHQELPIDVPSFDRATLGGVIATNFNGMRRYGCGSIRDHVIGIRAVDGRGTTFNAGGRVVKNVAGYDFCKLLCGSMGTLAVVTQLTLRVRPVSLRRELAVCYPSSLDQAESLLAELERQPLSPVAIELLIGSEAIIEPLDTTRDIAIVVAFEGSTAETEWSLNEFAKLVSSSRIGQLDSPFESASILWDHLRQFSVKGSSPLVARCTIVPSGIVRFVPIVWEMDEHCSIQAHAGTGSMILRFTKIPAEGLSRTLVARLQSTAASFHGHICILSNPGNVEVTRQSTWGAGLAPMSLMLAVKRQFDPANILNPGRFVFE